MLSEDTASISARGVFLNLECSVPARATTVFSAFVVLCDSLARFRTCLSYVTRLSFYYLLTYAPFSLLTPFLAERSVSAGLVGGSASTAGNSCSGEGGVASSSVFVRCKWQCIRAAIVPLMKLTAAILPLMNSQTDHAVYFLGS
jgi:hypothetical protein